MDASCQQSRSDPLEGVHLTSRLMCRPGRVGCRPAAIKLTRPEKRLWKASCAPIRTQSSASVVEPLVLGALLC